MTRKSSDAVSPVVGVMLMLVVTIIIAAVVSAFAGGLGGAQQTTPHATVTAEVVVDNITGTSTCVNYGGCTITHDAGFTAKNGVMFESTGGDPFDTKSIIMEFYSVDSGTTQTVRGTDKINKSSTHVLPDGTTAGGYFLKIGNTSTSDTVISPGDKFMFYADECYVSSTGIRTMVWKPKGDNGGKMYLPANTRVQWYILDVNTQRTIANGQLFMPNW